MPTYKLVYFNIKGRAEASRYLFALAGVEYEDYRLKDGEWATMKATTPFGGLPMLEVDGVRISQSHAIERYLAKQFGFAGKTELEAAQCDMMVDSLADANSPLSAIFREKDDDKKAELKKKFAEEQLPESFEKFEKILCDKGGDGWLVGKEMTWADIAITSNTDFLEAFGGEGFLAKCPKLLALRERVHSQPKIAEWIAKRPVTKM